MRALFPCICPVRVVVMYALQSAGYIPASDWVRKFEVALLAPEIYATVTTFMEKVLLLLQYVFYG